MFLLCRRCSCCLITHVAQGEGVYLQILHGQPEAEAQKLDVIVHLDALSLCAIHQRPNCTAPELTCIFTHMLPSVSALLVLPSLTQTQHSWIHQRCEMVFDKHSSQEVSHSRFTTPRSGRDWFLKPNNAAESSADFLRRHVGLAVCGLVCTSECARAGLWASGVHVNGNAVILSVGSRAINSMITHQSGFCVWLHNHRSRSHFHSASSYQRGYCFNPLFCCFEWAYSHWLCGELVVIHVCQRCACRLITLSKFGLWGELQHMYTYKHKHSAIALSLEHTHTHTHPIEVSHIYFYFAWFPTVFCTSHLNTLLQTETAGSLTSRPIPNSHARPLRYSHTVSGSFSHAPHRDLHVQFSIWWAVFCLPLHLLGWPLLVSSTSWWITCRPGWMIPHPTPVPSVPFHPICASNLSFT